MERVFKSALAYRAAVLADRLQSYAKSIEAAPSAKETAMARELVTKVWAELENVTVDTIKQYAMVETLLETAKAAEYVRKNPTSYAPDSDPAATWADVALVELQSVLPSEAGELVAEDVATALRSFIGERGAPSKWPAVIALAAKTKLIARPRDESDRATKAESLRRRFIAWKKRNCPP